jgi:hypothetical protein
VKGTNMTTGTMNNAMKNGSMAGMLTGPRLLYA